MATFSKSSFNSASYAVYRPTYPRLLYDVVLQFHKDGPANAADKWERAVDLGCGTGTEAQVIFCIPGDEHPGFQSVLGLDPSPNMVQVAGESLPEQFRSRVDFRQGFSEDLSFIEDGTVDIVTAAQSAHWFDWTRAWPELHRVLKPGGTFAFWGYTEMRLTAHPELTPIISAYAQGPDPATSLGPHWEPGRKILDNHFLGVDAPAAGWTGLTRVFYTGAHYPALPAPREVIVKKRMPWGEGLGGYLRTASALHRYHEAYPEDLARADGDIATRFRRGLMEAVGVPEGAEGDAALVDVEWPLALIMVRRV
ncbi:S-adenosyl-L-methionine-dependent methyltransferase [Mycena maculata]|uniref:S-adenosyl-L-methionine-dependent methyltransferase n=1 Tax=Mycena maculata TaxID=230809 RepID=A0AAD7HLD5_9AGAR|nr:S-adenosyl-L-methionine-dependent methyltransferase [Mycena maculata]